MYLIVCKTVLEARPDKIEFTAEIECLRPVLRKLWIDDREVTWIDYEWDYYGEITTSDPDQMLNLHQWFLNGNTLTEEQLFGTVRLLTA